MKGGQCIILKIIAIDYARAVQYGRSMEKKPRKQKRDYDFAVNAFRVVQEATGQITELEERKALSYEGKNPDAVELGRLGGLKGGKARWSK